MTASGFAYDKVLKAIMANPMCINQLIGAYLNDEEELQGIDCGNIAQLSAEFVDPSTGRCYYGDMLWKIPYLDKGRKPLYMILLLEFQSTACYYMSLRMLNYLTQLCLHLVKNCRRSEAFPLPNIMPVVFYTGCTTWSGPLEVGQLWLKGCSSDWQTVPPVQFKFNLLDINRLEPQGNDSELIWQLIDCLRTYKVDKLRKKWHNIQDVLKTYGDNANVDAWYQLFALMWIQLKEEEGMNTDISFETIQHMTAQDVERLLALDEDTDHMMDENGNIIPWREIVRRKAMIKGHAEGLAEGRAEGRAEGLAEGRTDEKIKNIKQALSFKFPGCTDEQVEAVLKYISNDNLLTLVLQADSYDGLLRSLS